MFGLMLPLVRIRVTLLYEFSHEKMFLLYLFHYRTPKFVYVFRASGWIYMCIIGLFWCKEVWIEDKFLSCFIMGGVIWWTVCIKREKSQNTLKKVTSLRFNPRNSSTWIWHHFHSIFSFCSGFVVKLFIGC